MQLTSSALSAVMRSGRLVSLAHFAVLQAFLFPGLGRAPVGLQVPGADAHGVQEVVRRQARQQKEH
jgi:hypothetical protein